MGSHRGTHHVYCVHVQRRQRQLQLHQRSDHERWADSEASLSRMAGLVRWLWSSVHCCWCDSDDDREVLGSALLLLSVLQSPQARIEVYFGWVFYCFILMRIKFNATRSKVDSAESTKFVVVREESNFWGNKKIARNFSGHIRYLSLKNENCLNNF